LASGWTTPTGTQVEVELPDAGGPVPARVVRCGNGELGVVSVRSHKRCSASIVSSPG
jgi:hypothetical protein